MKRLKRYIKPYLAVMLATIALLFCQAVLDLNLPNLMSDIVNNGIQKGGITDCAPDAIGAQALQLMEAFLSADDKALVEDAYEPATAETLGANWDDFAVAYPNAQSLSALRRKPDLSPADLSALNTAFSRSSYAMVQVLSEVAAQSGSGASFGNADSATMDMDKLAQIVPMLAQLPQQTLDDAIATAAATPDTLLTQTGAVFAKSFYVQLGADTDAMQSNYILHTGLKMLGVSLLIVLCAVSVGFFASRFGAGIARDLRRDLFERVSHFTTSEYDKFGIASLITRTTNDVTQVQGFLTMGLRMLCFAPIMGIGGAFMALNKSVSMAWIIALAVIIIIGMMLVVFNVAMPKFRIMQNLIDRLNLVSRENLSGMMVIRAFSTEQFEEKRFDKANRDLADNTLFVNRVIVTVMPVMMLVMNGVSLLIVWVGSHQIADSAMQVGDMMAFMQYAMQIIMSFLFISMMFIMIPRASVSAGRIADVLETQSSITDPASPKALPAPVRGEVCFHDVSFRYAGADENVLEHISFTAEPGRTTAFIGSTGSGKSTLVNLIPRFYDVTDGSITVDGVDVRDVTQSDLRNAIGYVPQKGVLFSGTIASNLRYGGEDADDAALRDAAETAQATEFIDTMPEGLATAISQGGTNVSGGQRQRLSIARALVKKPPIYIFDDTFSALDYRTDAKLRAALKGYTGEATVLIVAQRVSTIMHAEQIVVLDEGRVVGIGTHKELLESCAAYREIAQSQLAKEELG